MDCTFAHGEDEIGLPITGTMSRSPRQSTKGQTDTKRTICKFWQDGACDKSGLCTFAHGEVELGNAIALAPHETKRTICRFWEEGTCEKNEGNCTFAHGDDELGDPLPTLHRGRPKPIAPVSMGKEKRTICKFWQEGNCEKGKLCDYAHGSHQIGKVVKGMKPVAVPAAHSGAVSDLKRTLCKFWLENACDKGQACTFAHGGSQLGKSAHVAKAPRIPATTRNDVDVKRTICKFWQEGTCDKGTACSFAHGEHQVGRLIAPAQSVVKRVVAPMEPAKRTICKFWEENNCTRGNACTFLHGASQDRHEVLEIKRTICKFWEQNKCEKDIDCTFAHGQEEIHQSRWKRQRLQ